MSSAAHSRNSTSLSMLLAAVFPPSIRGYFSAASKHWRCVWKDNRPIQSRLPASSKPTASKSDTRACLLTRNTNFTDPWPVALAPCSVLRREISKSVNELLNRRGFGVSALVLDASILSSGGSLINCDSFVSMPCKMSHASIDPATRAERALPEDLIRLCVGIEDVHDLIQDLENAVCSLLPLSNYRWSWPVR